MNTYLLLWNPENWSWNTLEQDIEQISKTGHYFDTWSCGNTKSIQVGDRVFLLKVGKEQPKGIIASGYATSIPYTGVHWKDENKETTYIKVDFDFLLNPYKEPILTMDRFNIGNLAAKNLIPQRSGTSINPALVDELEALWFEFLKTEKIRRNPFVSENNSAPKAHTEGMPNQTLVTTYERNPHARAECLKHYGYSCTVCSFNFEKIYGKIGKDFIHVHHLTQIATVGKAYQVNPIEDLRPVCPNCHAMIHRQKTPLTIEEVKQLIDKNSGVN